MDKAKTMETTAYIITLKNVLRQIDGSIDVTESRLNELKMQKRATEAAIEELEKKNANQS